MSAPPDQFEETTRQLQLQLNNLNQLTAKQWLVNVILNRMKTTDDIISSAYGTGMGQELANKIFVLLLNNHRLTRFVLGELKKKYPIAFLIKPNKQQ